MNTNLESYIGNFNDETTEKALLDLLINKTDKVKIHLTEIQEDYFFNPTHQKIFKIIKKSIQENKPVDTITIRREANIKASKLIEIMDETGMLSNVKNYISRLKDYADKRWLTSRTSNLEVKKPAQEVMTKLSTDIINRLKKTETEKADSRSTIDEFEKYQRENEEHLKSGNKFIGIETGYPVIDQSINGIRKGHYWVITAYANTGKSYFLLNIANNLISQGKRVLFFSLEMSRIQNIGRLLGIQTGIDPTEIESGMLGDDKLDKEIEAKGRLYDSRLDVYNQKRTIGDIITTIYANHSSEPVDVVLIDYIQKIQVPEASTRYERYTVSSDCLQKLTQEIQVPVIVASQIDNESVKSRNEDIIATKGTGDIAGDVDFAVLLRRNQEKADVLDCFIQKNRHGKKGVFNLQYEEGGLLNEFINII